MAVDIFWVQVRKTAVQTGLHMGSLPISASASLRSWLETQDLGPTRLPGIRVFLLTRAPGGDVSKPGGLKSMTSEDRKLKLETIFWLVV